MPPDRLAASPVAASPSVAALPDRGAGRAEDVAGALLGFGIGPARQGPIAAAPLPEDRWRALMRVAVRERILALLVAAGAAGPEQGGVATSAPQREELAGAALRLSLNALAQEQAIAALAEPMAAAGIDLRLLKGHATAHTVYPDPRWRQSGDIDLAVPPHEFDPAIGVLREAGAQLVPSHELGPRFGALEKARTFRLTNGVEVDLHRKVEGEVGRYAITERDLFARPRPVSIGGATVLVPPTEVNLVHTALHLSSVRRRRSTAADLVRLVHDPGLDVEAALRVAVAGGSLPVLAWAVRQAGVLIPLPLPRALTDALGAVRLQRADRAAAGMVLSHPRLRVVVQVHDQPPLAWPGLVREVLWPSRQFLLTARRTRLGHLRHIVAP